MDGCAGELFTTLKYEEGARALVVGDERLLSCALCDNDEILEWALPDPKAVVEDAKPQVGLWPITTKGQKPEDKASLRCMLVSRQLPHSDTYVPASTRMSRH
jgi:hypothetical protein